MEKQNSTFKSSLPKFGDISEIMAYFSSERKARKYLELLRWGKQIPCQKCGVAGKKIYRINDKYKCSVCRQFFSVRANSIMEDSRLPVRKWMMAVFLVMSQKNGMSSYQLGRYLGIRQSTAWFMAMRIKHAIAEQSFEKPLEGYVSVDETYWGGREKNKHSNKKTKGVTGRNTDVKVPIFGLMEEGGKILLVPVPDVSADTLQGIIRDTVKEGSTIATDEWKSYNGLNEHYNHIICEHAKKQYVSENGASTNIVENAWSHLKRNWHGTHYHISRKHINYYAQEFAWRFNLRKVSDGERFAITAAALNGRLTYKQLIA